MSNLKAALEKVLKERGVEISRCKNLDVPVNDIKARSFIRMHRQSVPSEASAMSVDSPFYILFKGALRYNLAFPTDPDFCGPFWNNDGSLDLRRCEEWQEENISAVSLGGNCYRLAEQLLGPFSGLRLYWGDEFTAEKEQDGTLRLTSVCMPRPFAHFRFLISGGFNNDHQLVRHLHSLGGGWEAVAGGMLTLTVPFSTASEFQRLMYDEGIAPGVLPLEV